MAISSHANSHHFNFCKKILLQNRSEALKYLAFKASRFNNDKQLETHYYQLKQSEIEQLVSFFKRLKNERITTEPCSHRSVFPGFCEFSNNRIIRDYQLKKSIC